MRSTGMNSLFKEKSWGQVFHFAIFKMCQNERPRSLIILCVFEDLVVAVEIPEIIG